MLLLLLALSPSGGEGSSSSCLGSSDDGLTGETCDYGELRPCPDTCDSYLQCSPPSEYVMDCPPGLIFNAEAGYCDYPANTVCHVEDDGTSTTSRPLTAGAGEKMQVACKDEYEY